MKLAILSILILSLSFSNSYAEITITNLLSSSQSVIESDTYDSDYEFVKSNYALATGVQLFYAAVIENKKGNEIESLKYLIAGQIRSTTDMGLFDPKKDSDEDLIGELYGLIFYQFGGAGGNEIYRDKNKYTKIFKNIEDYSPIINHTYSPGWDFNKSVDRDRYTSEINKSKELRIKQLKDLVSLLQNEEYNAASKELEEIRKRSKDEKNAVDSKRTLELINKMRKISGDPQIPVPE